MKETELPQDIKWLNAVVLMIMAWFTISAIEPWSAWQTDPQSHGYGWNRFSYFTIQSNLIATATYLIAATAILRKNIWATGLDTFALVQYFIWS